MIYDLFVSNFLILDQSVSSNIRGLVVIDSLQITQSVRSGVLNLTVSNRLGLSQSLSLDRAITNLVVTSQLNLNQDTERGPLVQVYDFLHLWQIIEVGVPYEVVTSPLTLTQTITVEKVLPAVSFLELTDSIILNVAQNYPVIDQLELTQTINVWNPRIDPIPIVEVHHDTKFVFGPSIVKLRSPDFGNTERLDLARINRRSRAGNLIIFRDNSWPQSDVIGMTFSNLKIDQAHSLVAFMQQTLGKKVDYYDYMGDHWKGFILTPAAQVSEQYRNGFVVSLEFQGDRV